MGVTFRIIHSFQQLFWRNLFLPAQSKAEIKYLIDIKQLYALYACNIGKNVVEKTELKT